MPGPNGHANGNGHADGAPHARANGNGNGHGNGNGLGRARRPGRGSQSSRFRARHRGHAPAVTGPARASNLIDGQICRLEGHPRSADGHRASARRPTPSSSRAKIGLILSSRPTDRRQLDSRKPRGVTKIQGPPPRRRAQAGSRPAETSPASTDIVLRGDKAARHADEAAGRQGGAAATASCGDELQAVGKGAVRPEVTASLSENDHLHAEPAARGALKRGIDRGCPRGGDRGGFLGKRRIELVEQETRRDRGARKRAHAPAKARDQPGSSSKLAFDQEQVRGGWSSDLRRHRRRASRRWCRAGSRARPRCSEGRRAAARRRPLSIQRSRGRGAVPAESGRARDRAPRDRRPRGRRRSGAPARSSRRSQLGDCPASRARARRGRPRDKVSETLSTLDVEDSDVRVRVRARRGRSGGPRPRALRQAHDAIEADADCAPPPRGVRARQPQRIEARMARRRRLGPIRARARTGRRSKARAGKSLEELEAARQPATGDARRARCWYRANGKVNQQGAVARLPGSRETATDARGRGVASATFSSTWFRRAAREHAAAGFQLVREACRRPLWVPCRESQSATSPAEAGTLPAKVRPEAGGRWRSLSAFRRTMPSDLRSPAGSPVRAPVKRSLRRHEFRGRDGRAPGSRQSYEARPARSRCGRPRCRWQRPAADVFRGPHLVLGGAEQAGARAFSKPSVRSRELRERIAG